MLTLVACSNSSRDKLGSSALPKSSPGSGAAATERPVASSSPKPSGFAEPQPDVFTLSAYKARQIQTLANMIDAYNAGQLEQVAALLDENVMWSDCDYKKVRPLSFNGKPELLPYLQQRFADHDQLQIAEILDHNLQDHRGIGVRYLRRTSDTLRSLGFATGIKPALATKVIFGEAHNRISWFVNSGPGDVCRPSS
jgi:hypothetical protein